MNSEVVVIGFPKCGTSALMRKFAADPAFDVLTNPSGGLEIPWPQIQKVKRSWRDGVINAHKFTGYIFSKRALDFLGTSNPQSLIVLCIRDARKSLVSWHRMHGDIARSAKASDHFAYAQRDFYATCTIEQYFERYAQRNLQYDKFFLKLRKTVTAERIIVVAQERMADDMDALVAYIKAAALGLPPSEQDVVPEGARHQSYGEKHTERLIPRIENELFGVNERLRALVQASGVVFFD